jgi:hypothetical protein
MEKKSSSKDGVCHDIYIYIYINESERKERTI